MERKLSIFGLKRDGPTSNRMIFPQIGLGKVRRPWHERFAEAPDVLKPDVLKPEVLKPDRYPRTIVPVLDVSVCEAVA